MKTCFCIMPFNPNFADIEAVIRESSKACELEYVRGDLTDKPGSVIPQILHEIKRATVIVADLSGHNPNVFYELGIAHQIKGPDHVVIITQEVDGKQAYDVHQFRQFVYANTRQGLESLREELPKRIQEAARAGDHHEFWNVIKGRLPRTKLLVRDLERLLSDPKQIDLSGLVIRTVSGLGSLAISEHEPIDPEEGPEYKEMLLRERNALRAALARGARLKAILNPPRRFAQAMIPERLRVRYERLIGLLEGRSDIRVDAKAAEEDVAVMEQCEITLTPVPMPNQFIIGNLVAYEGMKRGGSRGFDMTQCETDPDAIRDLIAQFDRFFEDSQQQVFRSDPTDGWELNLIRSAFAECRSAEADR
ncbi:MAG: hypothetical protein KDM63_11495 [Verrucomicrobiae bacterium]|nr:hypothetical protein [Verrucomicrobiae bacterium]MCB1090906.1 hypothetical protein [Verrucomicrobiae bacterium]